MDLEEIDDSLDIYFVMKSLLEENLINKQDLIFLDLYLKDFSPREISNICAKDRRIVLFSIKESLRLVKQRYEHETVYYL